MIITLCGSTRFKDIFEMVNSRLTLSGDVVFSCGVFGHHQGIEWTEKQANVLNGVHRRKIDLSDAIYVINVGGYIGSNTRDEIQYAKSKGKIIMYYED